MIVFWTIVQFTSICIIGRIFWRLWSFIRRLLEAASMLKGRGRGHQVHAQDWRHGLHIWDLVKLKIKFNYLVNPKRFCNNNLVNPSIRGAFTTIWCHLAFILKLNIKLLIFEIIHYLELLYFQTYINNLKRINSSSWNLMVHIYICY